MYLCINNTNFHYLVCYYALSSVVLLVRLASLVEEVELVLSTTKLSYHLLSLTNCLMKEEMVVVCLY